MLKKPIEKDLSEYPNYPDLCRKLMNEMNEWRNKLILRVKVERNKILQEKENKTSSQMPSPARLSPLLSTPIRSSRTATSTNRSYRYQTDTEDDDDSNKNDDEEELDHIKKLQKKEIETLLVSEIIRAQTAYDNEEMKRNREERRRDQEAEIKKKQQKEIERRKQK